MDNDNLTFKAYFYKEGLNAIKEVFNPKVHYHEELVSRTKYECLEFGKIIDDTQDPSQAKERVIQLKEWYSKARKNRLGASFQRKDPLRDFDIGAFTKKVEKAPWTIVFSGASATLFEQLHSYQNRKWLAKYGSKICWFGQGVSSRNTLLIRPVSSLHPLTIYLVDVWFLNPAIFMELTVVVP